LLNNAAAIHHHHTIGEPCEQRWIVGNEDERRPALSIDFP
jgi:hypothetical protein